MATEEEIIAYLRLINTDGLGPIGIDKLLKKYGSAENAINFLESSNKNIAKYDLARSEIEKAYEQNIRIILKSDNLYPQSLLALRDAPPLLYAKGRIELLQHRNALAIVGSRNASLNACNTTAKIAFDLTEENVLIVSGMARGIDTAAHMGAMRAKNQTGETIAVLGTGIDIVYPPENLRLYNQIAEQGLLLSEMPLMSQALGGSFPRRNRIISGLSKGVLVTEASEKSGSLITARYALEQKRYIFAIPGSPSDPRAAGPNKLLRSGALWAEKADDILKVINTDDNSDNKLNIDVFCDDLFIKSLDNAQKTVDIPTCRKSEIEDFLSSNPITVDEIIRASKLDAATVAMQILDLELGGKIIKLPGNRVALKK